MNSSLTAREPDASSPRPSPPSRMEERVAAGRIVDWSLRLIAAAILGQTLFFKFTGAPESVFIFTRLGVEPWGRYASGVAELVAATLLLTPRGAVYGALLAAGVMLGAIGSHLTRLGLVVQNDGGLLFALAWIVFGCAIATVHRHRHELPRLRRAN